MEKNLNKLKGLLKTSQGYPKACGWLYGNVTGPNDHFYIYTEDRKTAIVFDNLMDNIWKNDVEICQNISKSWFSKELLYHLRNKLFANEDFTKNDSIEFRNYFLDRESIEYEIFKEIKGCTISSRIPITISQFTFYNWPKHFKFIKEKYPKAFARQYPSFYDERIEMTLVSTIIKSKDGERAHERADIKFKRLENTLRYLFTDSSYSSSGSKLNDIGIFDFRKNEWLESMDVSEDSKGGISKPIGTYRNLTLNKKSFCNKRHLSNIWKIIDSENPTKLENRILNSIEWIGKAKHEIEKEKAFIQYFFAIESLMNFNEIGLISPSVTSQMKEYTAFILGKKHEDRMRIDELFSHLYKIRSSIVHGSSKEITDYELEDVQDISENLVIQFLTNPKLNSLNSNKNFEELRKFIYLLKYASS